MRSAVGWSVSRVDIDHGDTETERHRGAERGWDGQDRGTAKEQGTEQNRTMHSRGQSTEHSTDTQGRNRGTQGRQTDRQIDR